MLPDDSTNEFIVLPNGGVGRWNKERNSIEAAKNVISMAYAGPTDASGKEICDKDILRYGENKVGEVFYNKNTGSFLVRFPPPKNDSSLAFFLQLNGKPKIIGNTLENPELGVRK